MNFNNNNSNVSFKEKCPVCLDEVIKNPSMIYPCFHTFCSECINVWMGRSDKCPICKGEIKGVVYDIISKKDYQMFILRGDSNTQIPVHKTRFAVYNGNYHIIYDPKLFTQVITKEKLNNNKDFNQQRLYDFIKRELETIFKSFNVEITTNYLLSLIFKVEIKSKEFKDEVLKYMSVEEANIFINEILHFAMTNKNVKNYDQMVKYQKESI